MLPVFGVLWVPSFPSWVYALLLGALLSLHWLLSRFGKVISLIATLAALLVLWLLLRGQPTAPVVVHSFGVMVGAAFLLGFSFFLWGWRAKPNAREAVEVVLASSVVGLLSAELGGWLVYGAPLQWGLGEMSLPFGLAGGGLYLLWFARLRALDGRELLSVASLSLLLALSVGKLACLLHGCDYGAPTASALAVTYPAEWPNLLHEEGRLQSPISVYQHSEDFARRFPEWVEWLAAYDDRAQGDPLSLPIHPLPLYESLGCLLLFFALLWRRQRGQRVQLAIIGYALLRFVTELFRGDEEPLFYSLTFTQWVAIVVVVLSGGVRLMARRSSQGQSQASSAERTQASSAGAPQNETS